MGTWAMLYHRGLLSDSNQQSCIMDVPKGLKGLNSAVSSDQANDHGPLAFGGVGEAPAPWGLGPSYVPQKACLLRAAILLFYYKSVSI